MTPDQMQQLTDLNKQINELAYVDPPASEAWNVWRDEPVTGQSWVCRDYVLMKAEKVRDLSWPESSLTVIECYTEPPDSGYHAVLGVLDPDDSSVTWIMDSRIDDPYLLDKPIPPADQYKWDRRQIPGTVQFQQMNITSA